MVVYLERSRSVLYVESRSSMFLQYERVSCGDWNGRYHLVYLNVSEVELRSS